MTVGPPRGRVYGRLRLARRVQHSPRMIDVYARVEAARRAKMVTVRKVGRKYECYAPGASEPFATKTNKNDACGIAWTYARFKLKNDAMTVTGSVIAEGFTL